ncbi:MAG: 4'-phosphopantetheinyl transferase superfamily protein [Bacteroidales bacterium]
MGIIIDKKVNAECRLGVWQIEEDYNYLFSQLNLNPNDIKTVENFKSHTRKLEWLSVRLLLKKLTKRNIHIIYNGNRKPFLSDKSQNISISHSENYTAVLLCDQNHSAGIDVEKMKSKIEYIAHKFLSDKEILNINDKKKIYHMYLHWCAKEALYKLCDKKELSFKNNITIEPFIPESKGKIYGKVISKKINIRVKLHYFCLDNFSFVWCCK